MLILTSGVQLSALQEKLAGASPPARRERLPAASRGRRGPGSTQVLVTHLAEASTVDWIEPRWRGWVVDTSRITIGRNVDLHTRHHQRLSHGRQTPVLRCGRGSWSLSQGRASKATVQWLIPRQEKFQSCRGLDLVGVVEEQGGPGVGPCGGGARC